MFQRAVRSDSGGSYASRHQLRDIRVWAPYVIPDFHGTAPWFSSSRRCLSLKVSMHCQKPVYLYDSNACPSISRLNGSRTSSSPSNVAQNVISHGEEAALNLDVAARRLSFAPLNLTSHGLPLLISQLFGAELSVVSCQMRVQSDCRSTGVEASGSSFQVSHNLGRDHERLLRTPSE